MKLLSLSLATVATSLVVVPASLVSAGTNLNDTGITNITKIPAGAGPLDLGDVYQRLSVSLAGQGAASYSPIVYHSNTAAGVITNNPSFFFFTTPVGQTLPVYVIYWGTGFTNTQTILIKTFLTGIGSHPYWNIVKSYSVSGWTAATVSFGGSCQTPYYPAAPGGVQAISGSGNNLVMFNEQAILSDLLTKGNLPCGRNCGYYASYIIYGGTDVTYSSSWGTMGAVTSPGASGMCATHGVCGTGMSCQGFSYAYIQMMPQQYASSSYCNVIGRLPGGGLQTGGGYPNNDFALDNAIAFTLHELTEMILSSPAYNYNGAPYPNPNGGGAFQDAAGNEPADKCSNIVMNVGQFANTGNIQVGGKNFTVFPLYHFTNQDCRMQ